MSHGYRAVVVILRLRCGASSSQHEHRGNTQQGEIAQHRDYSEQTALEIDREVKRIVMENYERSTAMIKDRESTLHSLAKALLEKETLDASEINEIMNLQPSAA